MTPENYKLIYKFMKKSLHQCLWSRHKEKRGIGMMKQLLILGIVLILSGFNTAFAQEVKFNFQMKNATLEDLFKKVEKNSEYRFIYPVDDLKDFAKFDVDVKDLTISQVLDKYLKNFNLEYKFDNKYIIIYKKQKENGTVKNTKTIAVSGKVTDKDGLPLPGATVLIKGTIKGTTTDVNGNYVIKVPEGTVLGFSFVGFHKQEIPVSSKNPEINVVMKEAATVLGEVQVVSTGYQTLKKSTVAGSISSIKAEELTFDGVKTLEQTLQGKLPGLVIINNSGLVGTRQKTIVRGVSTLIGSQDPVWVVDGVIQSDPLPFKAETFDNLGQITPDNFDYVRNFVGNAIAWLNPNDIEDITVLKDASATAIYGVRAGNGVIVINTKKGEEGPLRISYSANLNIGEKVTYDKLNLMNSKERVAVSKEIWDRGLTATVTNNNIGYAGALNDYLFGNITYEQFNAQVKYMETVNTDWFDILFRNPVSTRHSLSVSGGSASTQYYGSFGYSQTNGTAKGNDNKGISASFGINSKLSKKLNASMRISISEANTNGFYTSDPYTYASRTNRAIPGYNEDGSDFYYTKGSGYLFNINNELANSGSSNKTLSVNANLNINYHINKNLRFNSLVGLSQSVSRGYTYATQQTEQIAQLRGYDYGTVLPTDEAYKNSRLPVGGIYNGTDNDNVTWNWRNNITYSRISGKHVLIVMLGQEARSSKYTGFSSVNYGYLPERGKAFVTLPLTYTKNNTPNPYFNKETRISTDRLTNDMGLYSTINYSYDDRYAFNFSVRSDASNRFGQYTGEKFNPVYAAGVRWNMANEEWIMNNVKWLSMLNLRASFGYQRNIAANVSPDLIAKMPTGAQSNIYDLMTGEPKLVISSLPYGDLRWEKNSTLNLGLDFGFFNNRFSGTVEYYIKKSRDLISSNPVPLEYGVSSMPINGGSLNNSGIEISLNFIPIQSKNYTLSININTSKTFNSLKTDFVANPTWRLATSGNYFLKDYPMSSLWAFDFTGIDPTNGYPTFNLDVAEGKDPVTDPTSFMKYVGKLNPDLTAGLGLNFRYKMFTLSASLYLQLGGHKFLAPVYVAPNSTRTISLPLEYDNLTKEITERWTPTNTTASFPGLPDSRLTQIILPDGTYTNYYEMYNYSTARVANASTLRVNSINISYSLPNNIVSRLKCQGINVGFTAANPFAWVSRDFKGIDAEVATGSQPRTRSYTFNLSVNF